MRTTLWPGWRLMGTTRGHAPPDILGVELMDADCTAFQQGRVPLRPSLPPTPPRSDLRRAPTHTHLHISHRCHERFRNVFLFRHRQVFYESFSPIAGTRVWTKGGTCGTRDNRRSHRH